MICRVCRKDYGPTWDENIPGPIADTDYDPGEGRCYTCHLNFLFLLYGGFLEPAVRLGDGIATADGVLGPEAEGPAPEEYPF